jgi:hypothetical protein
VVRPPAGYGGVVPAANRMDREQFYAVTARLGPAELRKVLWTVYWRGTATVRERIETELAPDPVAARRSATAAAAPDPDEVLSQAREFVALVRSGAYIGGNRAVSPKERARWRFTFRRLVADARTALGEEDLTDGAAALTELIELACELRDYEYVRSDDPVEAAGVVVSDEVAVLWRRVLEQRGFDAFAAVAAGQFVRWESRYGWTRRGYGRVAEKEDSLTSVLTGMLTVPDQWARFTEQYLEALDGLLPAPAAPPGRSARGSYAADERRRELQGRLMRRTEQLTGWHLILIDRFVGADEEHLLDRVVGHAALGGPELTYAKARLAHRRGDNDRAASLIFEALEQLPGHSGFLTFAHEIDAALRPRAREVAASRRLPPP